jgi:hypothetical protein
MGRQDYWLGASIAPEQLAALPYKQRIELVTGAINGLGPAHVDEHPGAPDAVFDTLVREHMEATGADVGLATLFRVLEQVTDPSPGAAALVAAVHGASPHTGDAARDAWIRELADRFSGK